MTRCNMLYVEQIVPLSLTVCSPRERCCSGAPRRGPIIRRIVATSDEQCEAQSKLRLQGRASDLLAASRARDPGSKMSGHLGVRKHNLHYLTHFTGTPQYGKLAECLGNSKMQRRLQSPMRGFWKPSRIPRLINPATNPLRARQKYSCTGALTACNAGFSERARKQCTESPRDIPEGRGGRRLLLPRRHA